MDVAVAPNNQADSTILNERLPEMLRKTPELRELHHDAGYGSEDNDRLEAEYGIEAVQTAIRGRTSPAPIQIEQDEAGFLHVRCAAGYVVPGQPAQKYLKAVFAAANCVGCPFAAVCPARALARGRRAFYFTEADVVKQARHRRIETLPEERQTLRANVEATMKEFKAPCRSGKLRTRGRCPASRYGFLRAIAINFGRVYRHVQQRPAFAPQIPARVPPATRRSAALRGLLLRLQHFVRPIWPYRTIRIAAAAAFA